MDAHPPGLCYPRRLIAPASTWTRDIDVVVLGSGAAGLAAALAVRPVRSVVVVTKDVLSAGSTAWAQGGLAGVLHPEDSIEDHIRDTITAGAGLCDEEAVRDLVEAAPTSIRYLMRLGAAFDPDDRGEVALTREGGHSYQRIVHSGGDRSGAEVQRTLDESALGAGVEVMDHAFALDLLLGRGPDGQRQVAGVRIAHTDSSGRVLSVGEITCRAVVVACGGFGQIFASTSNPPAVTGDGAALALRAGLALSDVEFVQFHPTVMWTGPDARGQQHLVSEAVRGEGAVLFDPAGQRVMEGVHPLEDLAPRDVVAAAITQRMAEGGWDHVLLDATHMGQGFHERFPSISAACAEIGIDPAHDRIPVAPASHYACGGIRARLDGTTSLRGLYAAGEVSCTGVHGANRLASNSLTESIVTGTRCGRDLAWELPAKVDVIAPAESATPLGLVDPAAVPRLRLAMSRHVGVRRDEHSLSQARAVLDEVLSMDCSSEVPAERASWEATNLLTVAAAVVEAAAVRTESRGCHRRTDFPDPSPSWTTQLEIRMDAQGHLRVGRAIGPAEI